MENKTIIDYRNVEIHRNEHITLRDVNWHVDAGEFIYLVGKVGSGKTSLIKTVYAEVPVESGEARVFDFDLTDIRRADIPYLRRRIGIVFQDFQLLTDRTAWANLDFVLRATGWKNKDERENRIDEVLRLTGMQTKAFKMPHELSGGEQQRIVYEISQNTGTAVVMATHNHGFTRSFPGRVLRCERKMLLE